MPLDVHLAGETPAAAVGDGHRRLVVGEPPLLRRVAARAHMGVLAACPAYLSSSDSGTDLAPVGGVVCPDDLRAGDVKWAEADPTNSVEPAKRGS